MGYRTILAVVDTAENTRHLDAFVAQLAQQFSSHVIGLHMETLAAVPLVAPMEIPDPATVQALQDVVDEWTLAGLEGPRGQSAQQLQARLHGTAAVTARLAGTVEQALTQVLAQAQSGDRVLVFGSFHTAAAALQWLQPAP